MQRGGGKKEERWKEEKRSRNDVKNGEEKRWKGAGRSKNGGRSEGRERYKVVIINRDKNK